MQTPRSQFASMVAELQRNKNVELIDFHMADPASLADIEAARRLAGGVLPAGVEDFFRDMDGFSLEWRHIVAAVQHGDRSDHGFVNIAPIRKIFDDWRGVTWFGEQDQEFRAVKPFDIFVPEACAAFVQPKGRPVSGTVAYHYFGEELHDTAYSFDEYVERLLASRGFWYWIQTLCAGLEASTEVVAFREAMPLIFSDYDDSLFQPKR